MSDDLYYHARKLGMKAYNAALQAGEDPNLPVLEELEPDLDKLARLNLGLVTVPLDDIAGTLSRGRAYSFARNFMPILEAGTEFSTKWGILAGSVMEIGVSQPATMIEYLGKYYTVEGNKRVSVMKFLEADSIEADVTRYLPRRTEENGVYFEYCDFTRDSQVYTIHLTEPGAYDKLIALTGHRKGEKWSKDDASDLRALYRYFAKSYKTVLNGRGAFPVGEAFVKYLVAFGYENIRLKSEDLVLEDVRKLREEWTADGGTEAVNLIMDQDETASPSLFSAFFGPSRVKAAFLYTRPPEESGWNYWHELGRINAQSALGDKLETLSCVVGSRDEFEEKIETLIRDGYNMIFATSPVMLNSCIKPSVEHPEVKILCCSLLAGYHQVRSYYLRFYEAKFLMGMAAGVLSENGKIGYIADYPIYGAASCVNAFALGARMVNPRAKIYLNWSTRIDFDPSNPFPDPEICVISNRDINAPCHSSLEYGLYVKGNKGELTHMAAMVPDWSRFYRAIAENLLNGSFEGDGKPGAQNYWWGMSSGTLEVVLSQHFDPSSARLIRHLKHEMQRGMFTPFEGEWRDQQGMLRCEQDRRLTPAEVLCMDYLAENVIGGFPKPEEVTEMAQPIVRLQGMEGELKPDPAAISWKNG